jgi:hypothetical protein
MVAHTLPTNEALRTLFESEGFSVVGRSKKRRESLTLRWVPEPG